MELVESNENFRHGVLRMYQTNMRPEDNLAAVKNYNYPFIDALDATLGLKLVGPFEILSGAHKASKKSVPNLHLHWRFFYDPPEFQTILLGNQATQHHIGYYRYWISNIWLMMGSL